VAGFKHTVFHPIPESMKSGLQVTLHSSGSERCIDLMALVRLFKGFSIQFVAKILAGSGSVPILDLAAIPL
jgi:hypothetical protein